MWSLLCRIFIADFLSITRGWGEFFRDPEEEESVLVWSQELFQPTVDQVTRILSLSFAMATMRESTFNPWCPNATVCGGTTASPTQRSTWLVKAIPEQAQIKLRLPCGNEIRYHLANDTGKLEPVTRTRTGDQHSRMRRVPIEKEMAVWRVGVHAHDSGAQWTVGMREKSTNDRPHCFDFLQPRFTVDGIRIDHLAFVMAGDLHTVAEIRKAVEESPRFVLPDVEGRPPSRRQD